MSISQVTQNQILDELRKLDPERWHEVLDFIGYLNVARTGTQSLAQELTARDLLQSDLVGMWADRTDIDDSLRFARELRRQADHRQRVDDDPA